ncbi:MAG: lipopolysaccharide heptosyltransferase II, partial [Candidatus Omnitrophica bacterium]|nr:lipopolysaccharide heptosyltransferase II [Candidatus Omnitrophota bacterium]
GRFVIVASNVMARHMMANFGVPFDRIRLVPRGADLGRYQFKELEKKEPLSDYTIGIIGRLTPLKGHPYFLKAVSIIARAMPHIKVLVVGDAPPGKGKYKEELQTLARRLGVANIVEFTGDRDDVNEILKKLDLLVLSSVVPEGFGRVIIEAQASGVPVVATRVGGVMDIIEDGINGVLATPRDPASLAEAMIRVLKDRDLASRLAKEAKRIVDEKFSLEKMCRDTLLVYEEALNTKNVLVIKISAIGDVILSVPSLRAIRQKFQNANIKVLVGLRARNSLKGCPYINDIIVCDFDGKDRGLFGMLKVAGILRRHNLDIVVDLQNNRKSHLLAFLSCAALRFGYRNTKLGFFLNRGIKDIKGPVGPIDHQLRILNSLGISTEDKRLEIWPSKEDEEWADNFLGSSWISQAQPLVGINIGSSERWATKRWPINNIAKLCDELSARFGVRVIITGIKKDIAAGRKVASMTKARPIVACGKTNITQLAALMKRCRVFITADSAPIHVATAINIPFVALFGPTDPRRHLASIEQAVIIKKDLRCSPCYKSRCLFNYRCMKRITVEEVLEAASGFLKTK